MIGKQVSVTSTAAKVIDADALGTVNKPYTALIKNPSGGVTVYLGGSNVDTSNNSYQLAAGDIISIDFVHNSLWGVVASTTQALSVLISEG